VDLKRVIHSRYPSLPENQRKVADFLLQRSREVPFFSVVQIEKECGVSKATVVRLAQNLGFSGFLELREKLLEGVQSEIRLRDRFPLISKVDGAETLTMVANQDVKNINQTINHLDRQVFQEVIGMILRADQVFTFGLGISSLMASILAYSLKQVAIHARPLAHGHETFLEQLAFVTPRDLLIGFSFPPYSRETVDAAKAAAGHKLPLVAITDKSTSPITFYAERVLPIRSQNMLYTNSFSAISVIINALATEVAMRNKSRIAANLEEANRLLEESGYYTE
jgi:DNA-binding MurR/RpiR family transcriptional regulator